LIYDLFAVDNHFGGLGGGHYTAFAKNEEDGKWHNYDDSHVTEVSSPEKVKSSAAYLLFYRRRTTRKLGLKTHGIVSSAMQSRDISVSPSDAGGEQSSGGSSGEGRGMKEGGGGTGGGGGSEEEEGVGSSGSSARRVAVDGCSDEDVGSSVGAVGRDGTSSRSDDFDNDDDDPLASDSPPSSNKFLPSHPPTPPLIPDDNRISAPATPPPPPPSLSQPASS